MKAFFKKEWLELIRTGRLWILLLIFLLFGIMNPAIAKLTPWMMEIMSDQLAGSGLVTTAVTVDAMTSWTQFYKNFPMALAAFVLLSSGTFAGEYQKGTLIPVVTKGLSRRRIVAAKTAMLLGTWTVLYFLCFGITWGYNAYFWDNGIANCPLFAAVCCWLFGVWLIAWMVLFSTLAESSTQVLAGTGAVVIAAYALSIFPKFGKFLPMKLTQGMALLQNEAQMQDFYAGIGTACGMTAVCILLSFLCFDRKKL